MRRRLLLGLLVGALAMGLALWGVSLAEVRAALARASLAWMLPVAALFLVQQALRAVRQALLLAPAAGESHAPLTLRRSLSVLCVSFLFINTLPARLGEIVRPALLWERDGVPFGRAAAMVVSERAIDLCAALLMLAAAALWVPVRQPVLVISGVEIDWLRAARTGAGVMAPALILSFFAVTVAGGPLVRVLGRAPGRLGRLAPVAAPFVRGLAMLRDLRLLLPVLLLTAATWSLSGFMFVCGARAFGLAAHIGYGQGIGLLSLTMLGTAIPSAPAFAGTYEAVLRGGLALYGVSGGERDGAAVAMALVYHGWVYGVQACTAVFFLVLDGIDPRRLWGRVVEGWRAAAG